jgi:hypothetical protein
MDHRNEVAVSRGEHIGCGSQDTDGSDRIFDYRAQSTRATGSFELFKEPRDRIHILTYRAIEWAIFVINIY